MVIGKEAILKNAATLMGRVRRFCFYNFYKAMRKISRTSLLVNVLN